MHWVILWLRALGPEWVSAIATLAYVVIFVATVFYVHNQFKEAIKVRKLQVDIALTTEKSRTDNLALDRELYQSFFDNNYSFSEIRASDELKMYVSEIVRKCSRIGLLLESEYVDSDSPSIYTRAIYFIRMWIILEDHIRAGRAHRGTPTHAAPMQRVAATSLRNFLNDPANCNGLKIFPPNDKTNGKLYSRDDLARKLDELDAELKEWDKGRSAARRTRRWRWLREWRTAVLRTRKSAVSPASAPPAK